MIVWAVVNPDDPDTPIGGVWSSLELASVHCPDEYVVLKLKFDVDYLVHERAN